MLRVFNSTARYVDQGGNKASTSLLSINHPLSHCAADYHHVLFAFADEEVDFT